MMTTKTHYLLGFLKPYRARFMAVIAVTTVLVGLVMAPPMLIKIMFDQVIEGGQMELFPLLAGAMLAVPLATGLTRLAQTLMLAILGQRIILDIRNDLFRHLESLSLRFYNRFGTGLLVNRLMGDTTTIQSVAAGSMITVLADVVTCSIASVAVFWLNWRLALLLLVVVVLFVMNYRFHRARIVPAKQRALRTMDRMSAGVQERLNLNLTVRTYGREITEQEEFDRQTEEAVGHGEVSAFGSVDFSANAQLLTFLGWAAIYFLGCSQVLDGVMTYGSVIAFATYAMQVLQPAVRFSAVAQQLQDVGVALERIHEIAEATPEVRDRTDAHRAPSLRGEVEFRHVNFHYEPNKPVLRDFHMHVQAGETIALVGRTGCGKSTVLNLLFRFYDVVDGALLIDGVDLRDYRLRELRRHFGIVLQEPLLFETSILENVRFADGSIPRETVMEACRMAEIHDFISSLNAGYDTVVGGRHGITLSAGQQQQLTIARAIATDPRILVMDEATSNLDSESEARIQIAMDRVLRDRTCFIVAHRLSTIRNATRIAFMDAGHILELGSHDALMQIPGGHYRTLYEKHHSEGSAGLGEAD